MDHTFEIVTKRLHRFAKRGHHFVRILIIRKVLFSSNWGLKGLYATVLKKFTLQAFRFFMI